MIRALSRYEISALTPGTKFTIAHRNHLDIILGVQRCTVTDVNIGTGEDREVVTIAFTHEFTISGHQAICHSTLRITPTYPDETLIYLGHHSRDELMQQTDYKVHHHDITRLQRRTTS